MLSQFANELKCLYCRHPNPTTQWRTAGDLVPFHCQRNRGKHSLTITCPNCERAWYVVWDDDPGPVQNLSSPPRTARSTNASEMVASASHKSGPANRSVSDEDILGYIESADPMEARKANDLSSLPAPAQDREYEFIDLDKLSIPDSILEMIPEWIVHENCVLPVALDGNTLKIATSDPLNVDLLDNLRFMLNREVTPVVASVDTIVSAIDRHFGASNLNSVDSLLREFADIALKCEHWFGVPVDVRALPEPQRSLRGVAAYLTSHFEVYGDIGLLGFNIGKSQLSESDFKSLNAWILQKCCVLPSGEPPSTTQRRVAEDVFFIKTPSGSKCTRSQRQLFAYLLSKEGKSSVELVSELPSRRDHDRPTGTAPPVKKSRLVARPGADAPLQAESKRAPKTGSDGQQTPGVSRTSKKLSLHCPNCNKRLSAPQKLLGKVVNCPACRHQIRIPAAADTAANMSASKSDPGEASAVCDPLRARAKELKCEFIDLNDISVPESVVEMIPESVARENSVFPVAFDGNRLKIATSDPTDFDVEQKLRFILNCDITWIMAPKDAVLAAINRHYGTSSTESADAMLDAMLQEFTGVDTNFAGASDADYEYLPSEPVIKKLIYLLIKEAMHFGATYVHLVCQQDEVRVGYRVNRDLVENDSPPARLWVPMIMHIGGMTGIDRSVENWPLVCDCHDCGTRYVLGANASFDAGPPPKYRPDKIKLMSGQQSWPPTWPLPSLTDGTPPEILDARKQKTVRKWRCDMCKNVHIYDWSRPKGMRVASLSRGHFSLRIDEWDADVRVKVRFQPMRRGELMVLRLSYSASEVQYHIAQSKTPIVCTCSKCHTCYVLGVNAVAMTSAEVLTAIDDMRKDKGYSVRDIGRPPANLPDNITLMIGERSQSWPSDRPLPPAPDDVSSEIVDAQKNKTARLWQCDKCKNVQRYDWNEAKAIGLQLSHTDPLPSTRKGGSIKLNDPFQLDYEERKDERSFEWLSDAMPGFNADRLNTLIQGSSDDRRIGTGIVDAAAKQVPDLWIPWSWSALFRLRDGKLDAAQAVLEQAIPTCKERATLYEGMARVSYEWGDLIAVLGWSIKSFVAADRISTEPNNYSMLYIAQVSQMLGAAELAEAIRRKFPFTFDVEVVRRLQAAYHQCSTGQLSTIREYLNRFESLYKQKHEAELARALSTLAESGFPPERHPFCRHCEQKMTYRGTDVNDSQFFVFHCDSCGIPTGGRIDQFPVRG